MGADFFLSLPYIVSIGTGGVPQSRRCGDTLPVATAGRAYDSPNAKDNLGSMLLQCQQPVVRVIRLPLAPTAESGSNVVA